MTYGAEMFSLVFRLRAFYTGSSKPAGPLSHDMLSLGGSFLPGADTSKPIGIARRITKLVASLHAELKGQWPSVEVFGAAPKEPDHD